MKIGQCTICPPGSPPRPLIAGKCKSHYWGDKRQSGQRKYQENKSVLTGSLPKSMQRTFKPKDPALEEWFTLMIAASTWICENCGDPILNFTLLARRSAQAHIVPKSKFESVKTHPHNRLHLCSIYSDNNCHAVYDSSWDRASRMPVFQIAIHRFDLFKHLIDPKEYKHLPEIFYSRLNVNYDQNTTDQPDLLK